jgi:glycosyltransferase involved in cell wall biosynthesis
MSWRLLHVNAAYWPCLGGAEVYTQQISEKFIQEGHRVIVVTTDAASLERFWNPHASRVEKEKESHKGVEIHRCAIRHLPFSPFSFYVLRRLAVEFSHSLLGNLWLMKRLAPFMPWVPDFEKTLELLPNTFDLVHGVNISLEWPFIAAFRYARRHHLPFIATPFVHVGEPDNPYIQKNYTMQHQLEALRRSDAVIVQTEVEGKALSRLGVAPERIIRVGMGVDLEALQGGDGGRFRRRYNIYGQLVTFLGAVTYDKGAIHLVEAMRRLWEEGKEASLAIAGPVIAPGGFDGYYRRLPDSVKERIRLLGEVRGQLKCDLLAATDVFAMPSRVDSFGIVYLEAWAYKKPVIGARAGGVPEVIKNGSDGLLVRFGDVEGLAKAIEYLLTHPELAKEMGEKGFRKVKERYTWDIIYEKVKTIYESLT